MFKFFSNSSFYLWLVTGVVVSLVSGFSTMSQGSFFKTSPGYIFIALCLLGSIGIVIAIGFVFSFVAALVSLLVLWTALGIGGMLSRTP